MLKRRTKDMVMRCNKKLKALENTEDAYIVQKNSDIIKQNNLETYDVNKWLSETVQYLHPASPEKKLEKEVLKDAKAINLPNFSTEKELENQKIFKVDRNKDFGENMYPRNNLTCIEYEDHTSTRSSTTHVSPSVEENSIEDPSYFPPFTDDMDDEEFTKKTDKRNNTTSAIKINDFDEHMLIMKSSSEGDRLLTQLDNKTLAPNFVEITKKNNYADKLNYCFYCDKDVSHFVRHISTWHSAEITVQRILALPPKSKSRRELVASLRKKGNFVNNRVADTLRPVKRLNSKDLNQTNDFLPCSYCLGYYKRKSLYRHTKKCLENTENSKKRQTSQSDGQTTLLIGKLVKYEEVLTKELFPRMRADNVNLIAKQDMIICQYAYSYMKGRKSKGNLDFVRQNMRRLAKLLDFTRKQEPTIKHLIDLLKPSHFSLIIKGINYIARYNSETDVYESPTLAMNFGTLLKKCCDIAYIHLIQIEETNNQRKDLKILKKLIESQWADEISAQAALNLNEKKWNKNELLPLTTDLKKLSEFLHTAANNAFKELQLNNKNNIAYNTLKEVIYCQIILLNRRRPAEVAQIKIDKYQAIKFVNDKTGENEFENCLSETEKILINSYSRIVIRGKRGRGVPILLSPDMKKHFDYVTSLRNSFIENNKYIFHTGGKGCLDGTKILFKYAQKCGIDNPKTISATKLRKHLATITQLLHFSEKDLEQLSQFMGHTLKTHCKVYRLADNLYQTAKVSKLLLLMTEGGIEQYKGKHLDDIDIDLSPVVEREEITSSINYDDHEKEKEEEVKPDKVRERITVKVRQPIKKWSQKEKQIIASYFSVHIEQKRAPRHKEVEEFKTLYAEEFKNRKWTSIKVVVYNMYTGKLSTHF